MLQVGAGRKRGADVMKNDPNTTAKNKNSVAIGQFNLGQVRGARGQRGHTDRQTDRGKEGRGKTDSSFAQGSRPLSSFLMSLSLRRNI